MTYNIKTFDNFISEGIKDDIKTGLGKSAGFLKSTLHKAMTTDDQRKSDANNTTRISKTKSSDTEEMKKSKPITSKIGRVIKGENAFIDTKSGQIVAMDSVLNKEELSHVIDLWKSNDKKGAASILKNFAIRERNLQFNVAVGLMMSALCLGSGACLPKLKAQTQTIDTTTTDIIPTEGIGYKNALLKFYQELGDKLNIGGGDKFIKGSASKEEMFNLFDTLAKKKNMSTNDFIKEMFTKSHGGDMKMVAREIDYLEKCKLDSSIKTVGQIFNKTVAEDMTGVKGYKPFGISSPENAKALQSFFNDTVDIGKKIVNTTKRIVKTVGGGGIGDKDRASILGSTIAAGVSPSASGVDYNKNKVKKNESLINIISFDRF